MFDLKAPCNACPFHIKRAGGYCLRAGRLEEIRTARAFQCHSTVDYHFQDGDDRRAGKKPQQCAGLMAVLHAIGEPNAIMRLAEKVKIFDGDALDRRYTFETWADVLAAHGHGPDAEGGTDE